MMASWLAYTMLTTLLLVIAGAAGERVARALRAPTRAVWLLVLASAFTLSALSLLGRRTVTVPEAGRQTTLEAARTLQAPLTEVSVGVTGESLTLERTNVAGAAGRLTPERPSLGSAVIRLDPVRWKEYDPILGAVSLILSAVGILAVFISIIRLQRMARALTPSELEGIPILLSRDLGPAVLGFMRPRIVIPHWIAALPLAERRTVLLHEQEHAASRDPMLTLIGVMALALQPWNLSLWIAVAHLRFAIEADCDARVLGRGHYGARRYGALLLQVHEREQANRMSGRLPVTAFVDVISHLERRVRRMTDRQPRMRSLSTVAALVGLFLCAGMAVSVRVSRAGEAVRMERRAVPDEKTTSPISRAVTAHASPEATKAIAEVANLPLPVNSLPGLANNERVGPRSPVRVTLPAMRRARSNVLPDEERAAEGTLAPETLFVRSSNPIWPMKARIIFTGSGSAERVVVTDMAGHTLPAADTLVVNGPVQLALHEPPYHLSFESLAGDLSITTSPITDPKNNSRWVGTVLGRSLLAWRDTTDTSIRVSANGPGFVKGQRVP